MLKRIYIDNYKCLVNFELRLQKLTLLVGQNGTGKTAVLDAVYALHRLLEGTPRVTDADIFPTSSLTRWQARDTQVFEAEVELDDDVFVYRLEVEHDRHENRARIGLESLTGNGGRLFDFRMGEVQLYRDNHTEGPTFGGDWRQSALARVTPRSDNTRLTRFMGFMGRLLVCGPNPPVFAREASTEDGMLNRDGSNFVGWYRHLMQERQDLIPGHTEVMQHVLNGLRAFRLEKVGIETRALNGVFGDGAQPTEFRFHEMSDGQRALTLLYALTHLTAHQGHAILIDEPVNHVALREIQPWLMTIADACGDTCPQAVLCSHHPEVVDYLGAERAMLFWRDGLGPTRLEPLAKGLDKLIREGSVKLSQLMARGWER